MPFTDCHADHLSDVHPVNILKYCGYNPSNKRIWRSHLVKDFQIIEGLEESTTLQYYQKANVLLKILQQKIHCDCEKTETEKITLKPLSLNSEHFWIGFHAIKCPLVLASAVAEAQWFSPCSVKVELKEHDYKNK